MTEVSPTDVYISVGLPTYNGSATIRRTIESVLKQTHTNLQLIISDNASTDTTPEICNEYISADPRVKYVRQAENVGLTRNFNAALKAADYEYFVWISDDDWMEPTYLERCLDVLLRQPDYAVVSAVTRFFVADEHIFDGEIVQAIQSDPAERVLAWYRAAVHIGMFYGLFRRNVLGNGFPKTPLLAEDQYLVAAVCFQGKAATLEDLWLNRSRTGTSGTTAGIMKMYGVKPRSDFWLQAYKGKCAARDIMSNPVYRSLSPMKRRLLAIQVYRIVWFQYTGLRAANLVRRLLWPIKQSFIGSLVRSVKRHWRSAPGR